MNRRQLLRGALASALVSGVPRPARAGRPVVLVLTSATNTRSEAILDAFKAGTEGVTRVTYELGPEADAAAFLADNIRDMEVALVFAVGDRAFGAAVHEFAATPVVYADLLDVRLAAGHANAHGLSSRMSPGGALAQIKAVLPRAYRVGLLRGPRDADEAWWGAVAAGGAGLEVEIRTVAGPQDLGNASKAVLASCQAVWIQPDAALWTPVALSTLLQDALLARVPTFGFDRSQLAAAAAAPMVFESGGRGLGAAAAAHALGLLGLAPAGGVPTWPDPQLVGSRRAARACGMVITKDAAAAVAEWVD